MNTQAIPVRANLESLEQQKGQCSCSPIPESVQIYKDLFRVRLMVGHVTLTHRIEVRALDPKPNTAGNSMMTLASNPKKGFLSPKELGVFEKFISINFFRVESPVKNTSIFLGLSRVTSPEDQLLRGRAVVARQSHKLKVGGSIPSPATIIYVIL